MDEIVKALELKNQLDTLRPLNKEQEDRIMQKFRLDWNYHSNNLEGNSLTYGETKALLMYGITAQGKPLKDHFEVKGHNEAIDWVIDMVNGERPLTENFIRELHELLLKEPYEVDAQTPDGQPTKKRINIGKYKSSPNHVKTVTGEMFYFATPEETSAKMSDLLTWYNEKIVEENINPILLAAEFHYKFILIHPFDDGNGRTARILMNFILMKYGYPPVIIKTEDKANYFAALRLADTGNLEAFVYYIAKNLNRSLEIMIAGANGESVEEPDDIDKEIALLEKRLSALGEKSEKKKSDDTILEMFQTTIVDFIDKLIFINKKLQPFYVNISAELVVIKQVKRKTSAGVFNTTQRVPTKTIDDAIKEISDNIIEFNIMSNFQHFNRLGFQPFDYQSKYIFSFNEISYTLHSESTSIERPYGINLTESQIENIILQEIKKHKDFIEQKIIEKEKGH